MGYKRNKREEGQPSAKGQHIPNLAPDVGLTFNSAKGLQETSSQLRVFRMEPSAAFSRYRYLAE